MLSDTPEDARDRLLKGLTARRVDIDRLYSYYRGDHPLPWAPREVRDAYLALMRMGRSNWCRLVVQAPAERLRVIGLRFSEGDSSADVDVWRRYWQGNRLDAESRMVHNAGLIARRGFVLVWPDADDGGVPTITPEHPSQAIVEYEPGCRRERAYGLKTFVDGNSKTQFATLWTPEQVFNWWAPWNTRQTSRTNLKWEPWTDPEEGIYPVADNPLAAVPLVEFQAHPEMVDEPMGELDAGVTDIQDRINKQILDRLVTSNFASVPQKWATGLEIPLDSDGNEIEPYENAVDRLWISENPNTKFGAFSVADLSGYLESVQADIEHLAATTRTPPHYLLGGVGGQPASGDALKATETGLVAKVLEIRDSYTEAWEDVIRLALTADRDPRADDLAMSMVWKDPESRSDAEKYDAATKMQAVNVPWRSIMEYLGYSPQEIERMDDERHTDAADGMTMPNPGSLPATRTGPPPMMPGMTPGM